MARMPSETTKHIRAMMQTLDTYETASADFVDGVGWVRKNVSFDVPSWLVSAAHLRVIVSNVMKVDNTRHYRVKDHSRGTKGKLTHCTVIRVK